MATPNNLLEQLVMGLQKPIAKDQPVFPESSTQEDQVLATLLAQVLQPGDSVPPANVMREQLANDLGITEEDLTLNLFGTQNRMQLGDLEVGSLLQGVAQDRGLSVEDMSQVVRGNANLANVTAAEQEQAAQARTDAARGASLIPEPTSDDVLEGLLAEARGVTEKADPDATAAFQNKLGRLMRSPEATEAERVAAYQLRHPELTVEMQPNGVMSFSDKGPGLQVKDEQTRRAVENVRARLETLSPDQPLVAGEGSDIAGLKGLAATTKQKIADEVVGQTTQLFRPTGSKALSDLQNEMTKVIEIQDPNERFAALQRLGPNIAAYGNQRRSEIRNEVFEDFGVSELERDLAVQEARDRADPRWDEFRRDSPYTAQLRAQLRQTKADALTTIQNRVQDDPMLSTLKSQATMTDALVKRLDERDLSFQLPDIADTLSPPQQSRLRTALKAENPELNVDNLSDSQVAKYYKANEDYFGAVMALEEPNRLLTTMASDPANAKRWQRYIRQAEIDAGADEATADRMVSTYTNIANSARSLLSADPKSRDEKALRDEGGAVRALVEQWYNEAGTLSATEKQQRMQGFYMPRIIQAKMDYLQTQELTRADRVIKDLKPQTGHKEVDQLLREAGEKGYALGDLMNPTRLQELASVEEVASVGVDPVLTPSGMNVPRGLNILQDPTARDALARYISARRKEQMLTTAMLAPVDTYEDVKRSLGNMVVTGHKFTLY